MRLSFLLLVLPLFICGQNISNPNLPLLREHIYNGIHEDQKQKKWERRTYHFANQSAHYIYDLINNGEVYQNKPGMEAYVNKVLQKILPAHLQGDSVIHAYLANRGGFNASMTPSGSMFINISVLAEVEDEATLAAILAHEVAHYEQQHALNRFIKAVSGEFKTGLFDFRPYEMFSVGNEYQADSLSMIWLANAGYSLQGAEKCFQIMDNIYNNSLNRLEDKWSFKEETHPIPENRQEKLRLFRLRHKEQGKDFLISTKAFEIFKEEARKESLQFYLENFHYDQCIEKAFKYHLFKPNDPVYVYYILEAIRRKCYLDINMWKVNFITYRYYKTKDVESWKVKDLLKDHLFTSFRPDILQIYPFEEDEIIAKFYWEGEPKFFTYEQAYTFYSRVGLALGNKEVLLSNALSITHNDSIRNEYLQLYIDQDNVQYKEYAENLMNGTILEKLQDHKLTILMDFTVHVKQGDDFIKVNPDINNNGKQAFNYFQEVNKEFTNRKIIDLDSIKKSNLEETLLIKRMDYFAYVPIISTGLKTQIHILEPDFWELFNKYQVNEMEFLHCTYLETRPKENDIQEYITALNTSYEDLFNEDKKLRDFYIRNCSLREIDDDMMKHRYFDSMSFNSKEIANQAIPEKLSESFEDKDQMIKNGNQSYTDILIYIKYR